MFNYYEAERARKKAMTTAEKKAAKAEKDKLEEPYKTCLLDKRKEKVGNFRIEPPGLFRGRGEHPKKGALKVRNYHTFPIVASLFRFLSSGCGLKILPSISEGEIQSPLLTFRVNGKLLFMMIQ